MATNEAYRTSHAVGFSRCCTECGAALASDQRYCLECGRRVCALPTNVAVYIEAIEGRHRRPAFAMPAADDDGEHVLAPFLPFAMPSPRAAAVAVLGALAFGTLLGSGSESLASSPLIVLLEKPVALAQSLLGTTTVATPTAAPSGGGGGSSPATSVASNSGAGAAPSSGTPSSTSTDTSTTTTTSATSVLPPIKHVFVIMLADQGYGTSFSPASKDKYLSKTLAVKGEVVANYYGVAQGELANEIALISGQGPTVQTTANCPTFSAITPAKRGSDGQVLGDGCVYPKRTQTLAGQLTAAHDTWKAYVEGLGPTAASARDGHRREAGKLAREASSGARGGSGQARSKRGRRRADAAAQPLAASCRHPKLGAADQQQAVTGSDDYVTWRDPFVYFDSVTSDNACQSDDVGIPQLATDLKSDSTTPSLSYIVPGPCDDGSDTPCRPDAPAGSSQSDKFLKSVVPEILDSPAYKDGGMLIITHDQAPQTGPNADASPCGSCNDPTYPNLPATTTQTTTTTSSGTPTSTSTATTTTTEAASTTSDATTTPTASTMSSDATTTPAGSTTASASATTSASSTTSGTATTAGTTTASTSTTPASDTGASSTDTSTTATDTSSASASASASSTTTASTGTTTSTGTSPTSSSTTTASSGTTTSTGTSPSSSSTTTSTSTLPAGLLPGEAPGGGQVGMLVISSYVIPKSTDDVDQANHFSLLALIEDLFSLKPLGYASSASSFSTGSTGLFNNYSG